MKLSQLRLLLGAFCCVLILLSCSMANRLFTMRGQMCEFDEFVVLKTDRQLEITLYEPVLLERDINLLMDALPTTRSSSSERVVANYIFEQLKTGANGIKTSAGMELEFSFIFTQFNDDLRLSKITSSEIPPEILTSVALLTAGGATMAQEACGVSINPFKRSAVINVDQDIVDLLPDRSTTIAWFGLPLEAVGNHGSLAYEFRLKGNQGDHPIVKIDAEYDDKGDKLKGIRATYTRYSAKIDVPEGTMRLTLNK